MKKYFRNFLFFVLLFFQLIYSYLAWVELRPTVTIGILVRNKAFVLPYFFYYLERLDYPTERIGIVIHEDHSFDKSSDMVQLWCTKNNERYAFMNCVYNVSSGKGYTGEIFTTTWTEERMENVIKLRQNLINESKRRWAQYLFMLDADVILINSKILIILMDGLLKHNAFAISPLLNCTSLPYYSNFWDEMTSEGFYIRSDRYLDLKERLLQGIFKVPVINTAILYDLTHVKLDVFSFIKDPNSQHINDDLLNAAFNSKHNVITILMNNEDFFGYIPGPLQSNRYGNEAETEDFLELKFKFLLYHDRKNPKPLNSIDYLQDLGRPVNHNNVINVDKIFVINLKRRTNRNAIVKYMLQEMNINFSFFEAIDGLNLSKTFLEKNSMFQLEGYMDPFHKRGLKFGEIGCFLSHYYIWETMIKENISRLLILEDDIKMKPNFVQIVNDLIYEADSIHSQWDFIYLGRKIMSSDQETFLKGTRRLLIPNYSYRTTGYILKRSGALKLYNENPLQKLVALDEYIPIMFGKNPHEQWLDYFKGRGSLNALSSHPKIVEPSHFKGDPEYVSDTELTDIAFL